MNLTNITEEYAIYGTLFSLSNRLQSIGDKEFEDITLKQHFLMIALNMFDSPPSLKDMAELIGCSYQNVKRMANHLQDKKYLNIVQDSNDKRKLLLVSTNKIKELDNSNLEKTMAFMTQLYKDIPRDNLEITLKTLIKMNHNIGGILE